MTILEKAQAILAEKTNKVIPGNIKNGVTMFGVTGTVIPYEADPNLLPENIKAGVTIFGVTGTYTGDDTDIEVE